MSWTCCLTTVKTLLYRVLIGKFSQLSVPSYSISLGGMIYLPFSDSISTNCTGYLFTSSNISGVTRGLFGNAVVTRVAAFYSLSDID